MHVYVIGFIYNAVLYKIPWQNMSIAKKNEEHILT
jgi:hypothetical protein